MQSALRSSLFTEVQRLSNEGIPCAGGLQAGPCSSPGQMLQASL